MSGAGSKSSSPDITAEHPPAETSKPTPREASGFESFLMIGVGVFTGLLIFGYISNADGFSRRPDMGILGIVGTYLVSIIAGFIVGIIVPSIPLAVLPRRLSDKLKPLAGFILSALVVAGFTFATTMSFFPAATWAQKPRTMVLSFLDENFENPALNDTRSGSADANNTALAARGETDLESSPKNAKPFRIKRLEDYRPDDPLRLEYYDR